MARLPMHTFRRCVQRYHGNRYVKSFTCLDQFLCLAFAQLTWAHFRQAKAAIKLHTLLDLQGSISAFIHVSDGKLHDVNALDLLIPEPGAFYVVKTQIWTAISVYVLVAIIKKRLDLPTELYTILQILSLALFEKVSLYQLLTQTDHKTDRRDILNQLNLFD